MFMPRDRSTHVYKIFSRKLQDLHRTSIALTGQSKPPHPLIEAEIKDYMMRPVRRSSKQHRILMGWRLPRDKEDRKTFAREVVDAVADARVDIGVSH